MPELNKVAQAPVEKWVRPLWVPYWLSIHTKRDLQDNFQSISDIWKL